MSNTSNLQILQYNVQKFKNRVLAPLLADSQIQMYQVLAIQES